MTATSGSVPAEKIAEAGAAKVSPPMVLVLPIAICCGDNGGEPVVATTTAAMLAVVVPEVLVKA
jgi:hypothetical protein